MKTFIAILLATALLISGCAMFDGLVGKREVPQTNEQGQPLYQTAAGEVTTDPIDQVTGVAHKPLTSTIVDPSQGFGQTVANLLGSLFGPWGAAAGGGLMTVLGGYAAVRNGRKAKLAGAGAAFMAKMVERIKQGDGIDADKNGKISLDEIGAFVRKQGGSFTDPTYLHELAKEAEKALAQS